MKVVFYATSTFHCDRATYAAGRLEISHSSTLAHVEAPVGLSSNKQPIAMCYIKLYKDISRGKRRGKRIGYWFRSSTTDTSE